MGSAPDAVGGCEYGVLQPEDPVSALAHTGWYGPVAQCQPDGRTQQPIEPFGGANGDLRKNTYRSMSEYSPFLQIRETKLKNTRFDNYYAGVKGNLGWLDYTGQVNYSKASDLALFQTQYTSTGVTRFQALYDTVKTLEDFLPLLVSYPVAGHFSVPSRIV